MSYPHQHADPLTSLFAHNVDVFVKVESPIDSSAKEFKTFRLVYNLAFDSYTRFLIAYAFITRLLRDHYYCYVTLLSH